MPNIPETANKGLENIVACTSEISTIHDVTLLYRGYTIEDLAEHSSFEEVCYLLWHGERPSASDLPKFRKELVSHMSHANEFKDVLGQIAKPQSHSMAKLRSAVSYFGELDQNVEDLSPANVMKQTIRMTGAMGGIVAALSRIEQNQPLIPVDPSKGVAWNFLNMIRGKPPTAEEEKLFDTGLILHADHELNASTFTARVVASTTSDYYSSIVGALCSLKGPLHGGANEQVMLMLKEIGGYSKVQAFIDDAIGAKKKVMGIGHRVYKNGDPRARILKEMSLKICREAGLEDQYKMLVEIEKQMGEKKGLMPNVDFYSGVVYTALGLRPRDFTPIFAVSRVAGWSAQIMEQYPNNRIYRPRAFYTGKLDRKI